MDFELKAAVVKDIGALKDYKGTIVYGVPRSNKDKNRYDLKNMEIPTYNNAEILALMEHGSIINNIPKRLLLRPVREKYRDQIDHALVQICKLIIGGDKHSADVAMEKLAIRIEGWTKKFFTDGDNGWAPNSPITIHGGWMKNKKTGKPIYIKGKGSDRPLIDTGALRQSIAAIFYREGY